MLGEPAENRTFSDQEPAAVDSSFNTCTECQVEVPRYGEDDSSMAAEAVNDLTGLEWETWSDEAGRFNSPRMPVDSSPVEVTREGFTQLA